jgi:ATP-dependent DNA ligase
MPTVAPMLAKSSGTGIPDPSEIAGGFAYEPKWDGFRALLFKDGADVVVQSRDQKDLSYCFPELIRAASELLPPRLVMDGELVVIRDGRLRFSDLGNRIRPRSEAGGRKIAAVAEQSPVSFVAFDLLSDGERDLMQAPFRERRAALEQILSGMTAPFHLSPITHDSDVALMWFNTFEGAGLDGIICKPQDDPYQPGSRSMIKVKHDRTVDVVVAGWRPHKNTAPDGRQMVGALLLGLYDSQGRLHNVGSSSGFTHEVRAAMAELLLEMAPAPHERHPWLVDDPDAARAQGHRVPGGVSRWTGSKDLQFQPVRPLLVAEVRYDHLEDSPWPRFRHSARFVRWRPDRDPLSCTYEQLDIAKDYDVTSILTD